MKIRDTRSDNDPETGVSVSDFYYEQKGRCVYVAVRLPLFLITFIFLTLSSVLFLNVLRLIKNNGL